MIGICTVIVYGKLCGGSVSVYLCGGDAFTLRLYKGSGYLTYHSTSLSSMADNVDTQAPIKEVVVESPPLPFDSARPVKYDPVRRESTFLTHMNSWLIQNVGALKKYEKERVMNVTNVHWHPPPLPASVGEIVDEVVDLTSGPPDWDLDNLEDPRFALKYVLSTLINVPQSYIKFLEDENRDLRRKLSQTMEEDRKIMDQCLLLQEANESAALVYEAELMQMRMKHGADLNLLRNQHKEELVKQEKKIVRREMEKYTKIRKDYTMNLSTLSRKSIETRRQLFAYEIPASKELKKRETVIPPPSHKINGVKGDAASHYEVVETLQDCADGKVPKPALGAIVTPPPIDLVSLEKLDSLLSSETID